MSSCKLSWIMRAGEAINLVKELKIANKLGEKIFTYLGTPDCRASGMENSPQTKQIESVSRALKTVITSYIRANHQRVAGRVQVGH